MRTVRRDINAVYSTGLFDDVNVSTREAEDSTETAPKVGSLPAWRVSRCGIHAQQHFSLTRPNAHLHYVRHSMCLLHPSILGTLAVVERQRDRYQHADPYFRAQVDPALDLMERKTLPVSSTAVREPVVFRAYM